MSEKKSLTHQQRRGLNNKQRPKDEELRIARAVGGWRNPDNGTHQADVETGPSLVNPSSPTEVSLDSSVYEVKTHLYPTPVWVVEGWNQVLKAAEQTHKEPWLVVSFKEKSGRRRRWLVKELHLQ